MFESFEWSFLTILGPVVLAIVIGWALMTRRRPTRSEKVVRDVETRKGYDEPN